MATSSCACVVSNWPVATEQELAADAEYRAEQAIERMLDTGRLEYNMHSDTYTLSQFDLKHGLACAMLAFYLHQGMQ